MHCILKNCREGKMVKMFHPVCRKAIQGIVDVQYCCMLYLKVAYNLVQSTLS